MTEERIKLYSTLFLFIGEHQNILFCLLEELLNAILKMIIENLNSVKVD